MPRQPLSLGKTAALWVALVAALTMAWPTYIGLTGGVGKVTNWFVCSNIVAAFMLLFLICMVSAYVITTLWSILVKENMHIGPERIPLWALAAMFGISFVGLFILRFGVESTCV